VNARYYSEYKATLAGSKTTYYKPNEPAFGANSYCTGEPGTSTTQLRECLVNNDSLLTVSDIREQFDTLPDRIKTNCSFLMPTADFDLCIDSVSSYRELNPDEPYAFSFAGQVLPTDRVRKRSSFINYRAGELLSKPERLQHVIFQIPATGGVANIIVGGRKQSQGKYLLRARMVDFDL
jgi:hypothetical protein